MVDPVTLFAYGTTPLTPLTLARMASTMLALDSMVTVAPLSCTRLTPTMWVVVITVLSVLAGVRERVIGITMVLLVVLRTKSSFVAE